MYDPMVAKLIVWDADREQATKRMLRALGEYEIEGLKTLIPFHQALLATEQWAKGETCSDLLEDKKWLKTLAFPAPAAAPPSDDEEAEKVEQTYTVEVSGQALRRARRRAAVRRRRRCGGDERRRARPARARRPSAASASPRRAAAAAPTRCPRRCRATCGRCSSSRATRSTEGQLLCIIEAMKMENEITAHKAGTIVELPIARARRSRRAPRSRRSRAPMRAAASSTLTADVLPRAALACSPLSAASGSSASSPRSRSAAGRRRPRRARARRAPSSTGPWPGTTCSARATSGRRRSSVPGTRSSHRRRGPSSGQLDRREVVAGDEHARPRDPDGHPVAGVARRPGAARARARRSPQRPGTGSAWTAPSDSGRARSM